MEKSFLNACKPLGRTRCLDAYASHRNIDQPLQSVRHRGCMKTLIYRQNYVRHKRTGDESVWYLARNVLGWFVEYLAIIFREMSLSQLLATFASPRVRLVESCYEQVKLCKYDDYWHCWWSVWNRNGVWGGVLPLFRFNLKIFSSPSSNIRLPAKGTVTHNLWNNMIWSYYWYQQCAYQIAWSRSAITSSRLRSVINLSKIRNFSSFPGS